MKVAERLFSFVVRSKAVLFWTLDQHLVEAIENVGRGSIDNRRCAHDCKEHKTSFFLNVLNCSAPRGAKVKGFICKRIGLALLAVNIQTGTSIAFRRAVVAAVITSLRQPVESTQSTDEHREHNDQYKFRGRNL